MSETQKSLDDLVASETIKSYSLVTVNEDGIPNEESEFRSTQRLEIVFCNGEKLVCSGYCENTFSGKVDE